MTDCCTVAELIVPACVIINHLKFRQPKIRIDGSRNAAESRIRDRESFARDSARFSVSPLILFISLIEVSLSDSCSQ